MSVHDARPGDIYADANGKLWRVTSTCPEPTVHVEEVEPYAAMNMIHTGETRFYRKEQSGGVSGVMWQGFRRILRKEEEAHRLRRPPTGDYDG